MKRRLMLGALALSLLACSGQEPPEKQALVRAEGEKLIISEPDKADFLKLAAVERDPGGMARLPGRLVWNDEKTVRLFPQLGGRILRMTGDVGQSVKAGQTLALLSSADFGEALADARKANADQAVADKARERSRELREAGIIAEKDWQQAEADALRAQAEAGRAKQRLAGLGGETDGSYALKTPLAGTVVERNLTPGTEFRPDQAAQPLFVVTDPRSLWLQLDAAEADLAYLKAGESVDIEVRQYPGEQFKAKILHVADFVDPQSRTIKVRCLVDNQDRRLKAEMFAEANVVLPASEALVIPATAVMLQGAQRFVLVEAGKGEFVRRAVEVGREREGRSEIRSGLSVGERVVTEGNLHLLKYFKAQPAASK